MVIVGDVLQPVFGLTDNKFACSRWEMTATLILCVALPLTLLPTMDSLKFTSVTSLTCIIGYCIFVVITAISIVSHPEHPKDCYESVYEGCLKNPDVDTDVCMDAWKANPESKKCTHGWRNDFYDNMLGVTVCGEDQVSKNGTPDRPGDRVKFKPVGAAMLNALPIIFTAFFNHPNTFPISKELAERSTKTMMKISRATCTICGTVYFLVGLAGYFAFLDATDSDLLLNFAVRSRFSDSRSTLTQVMNVLRVGFGISFLLTFPLICWEVRATLDKIIFGDRPWTFRRHAGLSMGIVAACLIIGLSIKTVGQILDIIGSVFTPIMAFVMPGLFYIKSGAAKADGNTRKAWLVAGVGLFLVPACFVVWLLSEMKVKGFQTNSGGDRIKHHLG